jgi:hypothetical protein
VDNKPVENMQNMENMSLLKAIAPLRKELVYWVLESFQKKPLRGYQYNF